MTKQATLKELVQGTVEGFLATESSFSVHDLTQSIRQVVNSGAVEIPSLQVNGQGYDFEISHDDVKFYFNELLSNNRFSQPLSRTWKDKYFLYSGTVVSTTGDPSSTISDDVTDDPKQEIVSVTPNFSNAFARITQTLAGLTPQFKAAAVRSKAVTPSKKLSRSEVIDRVRTYRQNCLFKGMSPTTKQIQSAIKRHGKSTGWGREELKQIWQGIADGRI